LFVGFFFECGEMFFDFGFEVVRKFVIVCYVGVVGIGRDRKICWNWYFELGYFGELDFFFVE